MKGKLFSVALSAALLSLPAVAGNIVLTGHDDDLHYDGGLGDPNAGAQLKAMVQYAINGSALPVLTFDAGTQLTSGLTSLGISFVNVNPNTAADVTDALFDSTKYSAFAVASDETCGGCDNSAAGEANIAGHATAINNFLNAGGGIIGFAGAFSADYYAFVPQATASVGGAPSTGYSQTAVGATLGIPEVNNDPTHNLFWNPGTHGESAFYQVAEVNSFGNGTVLGPNAATTLVCTGCTTSGGVIIGGGGGGTGAVPEPGSLALLGSALLGLGYTFRRRLSA